MTTSWRAPAFMLVLVAALYVAARPWLIGTLGLGRLVALVIGISLVVGVVIAWWQARTRRFTCPSCRHEFDVSLGRLLVSQNWFGRVRSHCPSCGQRNWCDHVVEATE